MRDVMVMSQKCSAPCAGVGADEHGAELLAGPQLKRLEQRRLRQVYRIHAVAHEADKLPHLRARVEAVLAGQQVCRCQEILQQHQRTPPPHHLALDSSD